MRDEPMDLHDAANQLTDRRRRYQACEQRSLDLIHRSEETLARAMELRESASVAIAQSRMRRSPMPKTIRELREARGESEQQLADALGATLAEVTDLESGVAHPSVPRLRVLTEHFGVREEEINLEPDRSPTLGERLRGALTE